MYQPPEEMLIRGTAALLAYMQRLLQAKSLHTREQVTISSPDFSPCNFERFFLSCRRGARHQTYFLDRLLVIGCGLQQSAAEYT
jgi:hypothetical protein